MSDGVRTPDPGKVSILAQKTGKFINSIWYVLATLVAFLTFLDAAKPQLVGYLGSIEGLGYAVRAVFDRPALLRREDGLAALPAPASLTTAHADGYAYYEVSKTGQLTEDGRLAPVPKQANLPDFGQLPVGQILRAEDEVWLRAGGSPSAQPLAVISTGRCVQVVDGKRFPRPVQVAQSGGYLPVRRVSCPTKEE